MEVPGFGNNTLLLDQHTAMKQAINQQYKDFLADRAFDIYCRHVDPIAKESVNTVLAKQCFRAVKIFVDTIDGETV